MKVNLHDGNQQKIIDLQSKMLDETGEVHTIGHLTNLILARYFSTMIPIYEDLHNANYSHNNQHK